MVKFTAEFSCIAERSESVVSSAPPRFLPSATGGQSLMMAGESMSTIAEPILPVERLH